MNERGISGGDPAAVNVVFWVNRTCSSKNAAALAKIFRVEAAVGSHHHRPLSVVSATLRDKPEARAPKASGTA